MMIRSFTNSKSEAFYVMGFSSLDERHRMFRALTESAVFLHDLREHMEYSELLTRLEKRDAGRIDIPDIVSAIPLRNSEMNLLVESITTILLDACMQRSEAKAKDDAIESSISDDMIAPADQTSMWDTIRYGGTSQQISPFARDPKEEAHRRMLARHKLWLDSLQHEYPSPYAHYRIGVYIRYFNQTRHENYLLFHKQEFIDTIALCPNWTLVDFYVDEGQTAPYMENAKEWSRLLQDCLDGKIDLIITQKVSNVTRNPNEITLTARVLATQPKPVGIYFVNEDIFTLASYYQTDMREKRFFPSPDWQMLPDDQDEERRGLLE